MCTLQQQANRQTPQSVQAKQYTFPYHYTPQYRNSLYLSRHWGFAASYVAALQLVAERLQSIAQAAGPEWQHIDIGCGDGALLHHLSQIYGLPVKQIAGLDTDAHAVAWARMFNPHNALYACDISELERNFHSATLVEVLEHIPPESLPEFVTRAADLLHPGGQIIITVPSTEKKLATKHYQHFSLETIGRFLEPHFEDIDIQAFERGDMLTRLISTLRMNHIARIDAPFLNQIAVRRFSRLYQHQRGCGRLLVTGRRSCLGSNGQVQPIKK